MSVGMICPVCRGCCVLFRMGSAEAQMDSPMKNSSCCPLPRLNICASSSLGSLARGDGMLRFWLNVRVPIVCQMVGRLQSWGASIVCIVKSYVTKSSPPGHPISHQPLGVACKDVAQMTSCSPSRTRLKRQVPTLSPGMVLSWIWLKRSILYPGVRSRLLSTTDVTSAWLLSLQHLVRFPTFHGGPVASSTGLPEGDSMSVVGMLGLSHVYHNFMSRQGVCPTAYADNWGVLT